MACNADQSWSCKIEGDWNNLGKSPELMSCCRKSCRNNGEITRIDEDAVKKNGEITSCRNPSAAGVISWQLLVKEGSCTGGSCHLELQLTVKEGNRGAHGICQLE